MNETTQIVLYALIAGLSPLALLATLAVLGSGRGRLNGSLFAVGFLLTQSTVLLVAFLLGAAATPDRDHGHERLSAALGLAAGVGLIALAARQRSSGEPEERIGSSRTEAVLERLGRLRPATAFSFGALLGVGGVKRLTITLLAGASIALTGLLPAEELALGIAYVRAGERPRDDPGRHLPDRREGTPMPGRRAHGHGSSGTNSGSRSSPRSSSGCS